MPRLIQLSDPHLLAQADGKVRGRSALSLFRKALDQALAEHPNLLLITGDCCHDETWCGYVRLRDMFEDVVQIKSNNTQVIMVGNGKLINKTQGGFDSKEI